MRPRPFSAHKLKFALTAACVSLLLAQSDTPEALNKRALQAYQSKDYATFLVLEKHVLSLNPADPRALYNVASAESLTGHPAEAVSHLDQLLLLNLDFGAEKDADFDGIRKTPEWHQFEDHLAALRKPVIHSTVAFTLPEKGLLAGSVAVDEARGDTYIGSVRERKILKRAKDGVITDFATEKDGLLAVTSLLIDPVRHQLFAGVSAVPFMQNFHQEDEGKAAILVFDLATGKLIRSAPLAISGEHHLLAQMAQEQSGTVFILDTASSEIRRLRRSSTELELFLSSVVFRSPHSLALSADERTLYVMDWATGFWAVDVLSIDRTQVRAADNIWLGGLAGLLQTSEGLLSLQTGALSTRVVRIHLDAKAAMVTSLETLESNHQDYDVPALGTLSGPDLLYIANSQFGLLNSKTSAVAMDRAKETVMLRLPLGK